MIESCFSYQDWVSAINLRLSQVCTEICNKHICILCLRLLLHCWQYSILVQHYSSASKVHGYINQRITIIVESWCRHHRDGIELSNITPKSLKWLSHCRTECSFAIPERSALISFLQPITPLPQTIELRVRTPYTILYGHLCKPIQVS